MRLQAGGIVDEHEVPMSPKEQRLAVRLVRNPPPGFMPLVQAQRKARSRFPVAQAVLMWRNLPGMEAKMWDDDAAERAATEKRERARKRKR